MKKLGYFLIVLFSFFIASGKVSARVPDECNAYTVVRFNADLNRSLGAIENVCSYRPLGITPLNLDNTNGVKYINIYHLDNSNGDIYYFVEVTEYSSKPRELEMLACAIKKSDGTKEAHTNLEGWHSNGTPSFDDDSFDAYFPYYSDDNGIFIERDPGAIDGQDDIRLYDELDGWYGTQTSFEGHSNKHYCPAYAGKITASPLDRGPYSTLAYLTRDYDNNMEIPTTLNDGTFTTDYFKPLTYAASNFYSDSVNTSTGQIDNMTTVSQTNYYRTYTNDSISAAASNSVIVSDWDSCNQYGVLKTLDIVHTALLILRILVPLVLIILGSIDFGKAGISGDDDLVTKATKTLVRRGILGVAIFFIPTITFSLVNLADDRNPSNDDMFYKCAACFTGDNTCENYLQSAEGKVEVK